jgi:hypothetical protein
MLRLRFNQTTVKNSKMQLFFILFVELCSLNLVNYLVILPGWCSLTVDRQEAASLQQLQQNTADRQEAASLYDSIAVTAKFLTLGVRTAPLLAD